MHRRYRRYAEPATHTHPPSDLGRHHRLDHHRPHSHKEKHLAKNPYVSLSYWDQQHQQIYADCKAEWCDDEGEKKRIWNLYKSTPPPLGYDPQIIWQAGVEDPTYGLLKLTPWRIELYALSNVMTQEPAKIWRAP